MAISSAFTLAAKRQFLTGKLLDSHTYKLALFYAASNLSAATGGYTTGNEIQTSGTSTGYTAGGNTLTGYDPGPDTITGTTAWITWANTSWSSSTFTPGPDGCMIYDDSDASGSPFGPKTALCTIDFGGAKPVSSGTFTIQFPTADATNAILRLA